MDAASLPQKTELTLACMNLDWDLRSRIVKFNRESSQYRIVVKDYADYSMAGDTVIAGQTSDGITKLNTELLSGNVPDLLISSGLPVQQYAAKGLLEDLWQYIDADENVKRENLMTDVLNAAETGRQALRAAHILHHRHGGRSGKGRRQLRQLDAG